MTFQTSVRLDQTSGIVGEYAFDGPTRAFRYLLSSTSAANNVFGRAFTIVSETTVTADGGGTLFAGILVNPKQSATSGTTSGTLEPTLTLRNNESGDLCTMGQIFVNLLNAANIGDSVAFNNTTGELTAFAPGAIIAAPQIQIPGATVVRCDTSAAGLAIIQLTNQQSSNPTS